MISIHLQSILLTLTLSKFTKGSYIFAKQMNMRRCPNKVLFKILTNVMQLKHEVVTLNTLEFEFSHTIILAAFEFLSIIVSSVAKHGELYMVHIFFWIRDCGCNL